MLFVSCSALAEPDVSGAFDNGSSLCSAVTRQAIETIFLYVTVNFPPHPANDVSVGVLQVCRHQADAWWSPRDSIRRRLRAPQGRVLHGHQQDAEYGVQERGIHGGGYPVVWVQLGFQLGVGRG